MAHNTKVAGYATAEGLIKRWIKEGNGKEFEPWIRGSGYLARPNDPKTVAIIEKCNKIIEQESWRCL